MPLSVEDRAARLDAGIAACFEVLHTFVPGASFVRRTGHVRIALPSVPIPIFNGVVIEGEPCPGAFDSAAEVEALELPVGVQLRAGTYPAVEAEAARLGFAARATLPGLTLEPGRLAELADTALEVAPVEDERGLVEAAHACAAAFGAPPPGDQTMYVPELLPVGALTVYLGHVDGVAVTTAIGVHAGGDGGIFAVATPAEHRRRGYGAAVTARAARDLFAAGAGLVWLQASELGEPVYRKLGFEHVVDHLVLTRG